MEGRYSGVKKVVCVGAAGGGLYYVARFFNLLGAEVTGFDISKNKRYEDLEKSGVKMFNRNPDKPFDSDTDVYIYSEALPDKLISSIEDKNKAIKSVEVGVFFTSLTEDYEKGILVDAEEKAFKESNIAPLYRIDTSKMKYIGVTGTDGKTTTATMIYHILSHAGYKPALVSTVSAKIGDKDIDTGFHVTSPPAQDMYKFIKQMEKEDCTHVILEVTSHGLAMGRLAGMKFDVAVYTNITNEHLDYHDNWQGVFDAKSRLIKKHLRESGVAVLNADDEQSYGRLASFARRVCSYGWESDKAEKADVIAEDVTVAYEQLNFKLHGKSGSVDVSLPLLGKFNISNALAASCACMEMGVLSEEISQALSTFETVDGRMDVLQRDPYTVVVDFAHTPNALKNALQSARELLSDDGRLIVVFGCAGKRDKYKRSEMGKIAGCLADVTILTAEDSRTESLEVINDEIEKGWRSTVDPGQAGFGKKQLLRFDDDSRDVEVRRTAIKKALSVARSGDVVIVCGKAHEKSLCFGLQEYLWNDISETRKLLVKN